MKLAWWAVAALLLAGCTAPAPAQGIDPVVGDGALSIVLHEDYQCPHCRDYSLSDAFQQLLDGWVANGTVQLVFQHVAFVGPLSEPAAITSRCIAALAPDAWLAWDHDVYAALLEGGSPDSQTLHSLASQHGVRAGDLVECEEQPGSSEAVQRNTAVYASYRHGTPALVIAGVAYNPNDMEAVDAAIQAAL